MIAVDAMGGDYAPHEVVKGAVKAWQECRVDIALVGRGAILRSLLGDDLKKTGLTIVEASQVIGVHDSPVKALQTKTDSSIVVGIGLVKKGLAQAFVSAGNTGAVFGAALFLLGKIEGIERPAIAAVLNITDSTPVLLIDAGANADCRPGHLVQFAQLGAIYANKVLGIASPRIGLLSIGQEETKGNRLTKETHQLLKKTDLNFFGNVEGQDMPKGIVDVVVTDGFTGNVALKTLEGVGDAFKGLIQHLGQSLTSSTRVHGRLLVGVTGLGYWAKKVDYTEYGGACLVGVKGNVIIVHGRSQAKAIKNAILLAKQTAEHDTLETIRQESQKYAAFLKTRTKASLGATHSG
ncbi:MAG: phosphate acyltransferase PlsX [Chloroflexota bacterium]